MDGPAIFFDGRDGWNPTVKQKLQKSSGRQKERAMNATNEEVDLAIPNMHSREEETRAGQILRGLPGVTGVRLVQRGAWIAYRPATITHERICAALRHVGFRVNTFQDSATGFVGSSSV